MGAEDNDMLERAMDAAEAKLMDETQETEAETVTPEPETLPDKVEEAHVAKVVLDENKKSKARDTSGKFTKKAAAPKTDEPLKTDLNDQEVSTSEQEVAVEQPIEPPQFWSPEQKEAFAKAPLEVKQAVLSYEEQRNQWANRLATETERGRALEKRAKEVFEPYQLKLQANGIKDPLEAAERLLAWNELFEKDVETGLVDLMQKNGITPESLAQIYYGTREENQYSDDPRIAKALQDAEEAKKAADEFRAQLEQQQQQSFIHEVNNFKMGKDSSGKVRKEFAELYAPQISKVHDEITELYPNVSSMEALNMAYEHVKERVQKYHGGSKTVQAKSPENIAKAKGAASSVTGGPSSGSVASRPGAKDIDEALDRAEERLGLR